MSALDRHLHPSERIQCPDCYGDDPDCRLCKGAGWIPEEDDPTVEED